MSKIQIEHGTAEVTLDGIEMRTASGSTDVTYAPRDLMDATAAALLAVNTPQTVAWADALYRLTAGAA